jgi:hypothetical protein
MAETRVTLYDTTAELTALLDRMAEMEEDPTPEAEAAIQATIWQQIVKVQGWVKYIRHLDSQIALAEEEIKRLQSRKKALENARRRLLDYALRVMDQHGFERLDGETASLCIQPNPPALNIWNESAIPAEFLTIKQETLVDKVALKAALRAGRQIDGCELTVGRTVRIK